MRAGKQLRENLRIDHLRPQGSGAAGLGAHRRHGPQDGRFSLYQAAKHGHAAAARLLLEHGADANLSDNVTSATARRRSSSSKAFCAAGGAQLAMRLAMACAPMAPRFNQTRSCDGAPRSCDGAPACMGVHACARAC